MSIINIVCNYSSKAGLCETGLEQAGAGHWVRSGRDLSMKVWNWEISRRIQRETEDGERDAKQARKTGHTVITPVRMSGGEEVKEHG